MKILLLLALLATTGCAHRINVGDGLILKSPNGTKYEISVDDAGQSGVDRVK